MPAIRLSNWNHRQITENVVKRSPQQKAADECDAVLKACADKIYEQSLTKAQHEVVKSMPVEWFSLTDRFYVKFHKPGNKEHINLELRLSSPRRTPATYYHSGYVPVSYGLAIEEYEVARKKWNAADEAVRALTDKVMSAVSAHRTLEALLKAWPELKTEIPAELKPVEKVVSTAIMAIPGLNEALGLPKEEPKPAAVVATKTTKPRREVKLKKAA
jgi:hypothetical protein